MKIGIVGSGMIVKVALDALEKLKENIEKIAICDRKESLEIIKDLGVKSNISKIYTDYKELLKDENIDTVYLGIINSMNYEYCKKALESGKNVICEKPFTSNIRELKELIDLAKSKNLFLFEAITMIYSPNFNYLKNNLNDLGDIKLVHCNYSQYSSRYDKYLEGTVLPAFDWSMSGGSLYDINIYNIHFVVGLFGKPNAVKYHANIGFNGIDTSGILILSYDKFTAVCIGAKDSTSVNHATVQGIKGYLKVNSSVNISKSIDFYINNELTTFNGEFNENHMINEFSAFSKIIDNKDFETCYKNLRHSEIVMEILCDAKKDAGIIFSAD